MKKKISLLLVVALLCNLFISCTNRRLAPLNKMKYVEWKSDNPNIYFRTLDSAGDGYGYVIVNGEKIDAYFYLYTTTGGSLNICPLDEKGIPNYSNRAMYPLDYVNGKITIGKVEKDTFGVDFGPATFEKGEVDRSTIEAWEYTLIEWETENLSFVISKRYGEGMVTVNGVEREITFLWGLNKDFKIYEGYINDFNATPIAEGTYTNVETEAVLTFTHDELFNFEYPELTINGITLSQKNNS